MNEKDKLSKVFEENLDQISAVIHFAGLKVIIIIMIIILN